MSETKMQNVVELEAGSELDAKVAAALGWRAYVEKRGGYALCVVLAPGERPQWERTQYPDPERYTEVSCEEAVRIGFYGDGFPRFSAKIADAWRAVDLMRDHPDVRYRSLSLVAWSYSRTYATFDAEAFADYDLATWAEANGEHATPLAIARAVLLAPPIADRSTREA